MAAEPTYRHSRLPLFMRAYNRVARSAATIGWQPAPLRATEIADRARRRTALDRFGFGDWREPLEVMVDSLNGEAALSPLGRSSMRNAAAMVLPLLAESSTRTTRSAPQGSPKGLFAEGPPTL